MLPVPNEEAIRYALKIGAALGCEVAPRSIFHRKNYFYPDNPKAYQISQYDIPICSGGRLGEVRIHRAHLEEDAAKMIHVGESGRIHGSGASLVDFNRGGTPLVEIVTEPDLRSARRGRRLGAPAARDGAPARRLRREHGGGQPAGRRQRLRAPGRQRGARHQDRAEEHEQLPLPRARGRGRADPPARGDRGGRQGRPGDPPLRPAHRRPDPAALEGGGARLPLLPRARPGAAGADRGDGAGSARVAAGAAGGADRALRGDRPLDRDREPARRRPGDGRLLRAGRRRPPRRSRRSSPTG